MHDLAPIVLFVYNRVEHVEKTINALQKNYQAPKSQLFIFSDGAKNANDEDNVRIVRKYIRSITGFKEVTVIERNTNYGLSKSIIEGVSSIINEFEKIIVLEDDLVTSPFFLTYMNSSLDTYKNEAKVGSIHGYIYPISGLPDLFFIRGADCWGWATWRDRWALFEKNGQLLLDQVKKKKLMKDANFNNTYYYTKMLEQQVCGQTESWAIRWYFSMYLLDKLTLYPGRSYVRNIGFDGYGVHGSVDDTVFDVNLKYSQTPLKKQKVIESSIARKKMEQFFRTVKPSLKKRIYNKIGRVFRLQS